MIKIDCNELVLIIYIYHDLYCYNHWNIFQCVSFLDSLLWILCLKISSSSVFKDFLKYFPNIDLFIENILIIIVERFLKIFSYLDFSEFCLWKYCQDHYWKIFKMFYNQNYFSGFCPWKYPKDLKDFPKCFSSSSIFSSNELFQWIFCKMRLCYCT